MSTLERLRSANLVPDPDRLLSGSRAMDELVAAVDRAAPGDLDERPPIDRTRRGWLVAAVAAVVVLVMGTLVAVLRAPANPQPAGPSGAEQVAYVERAYALLNDGDVDGWLRHFAEDASFSGRSAEIERRVDEILAAANRRLAIVEPCTVPAPDVVVCTITETTDFFGAGGLSITKTETFAFDDDGRISERSSAVRAMTQPGYYVYTQAFNEWMAEAHPDVYAEIRPEIITHLPQTPEDMRRALEYIDEFIAQSGRYPVGDE